jgi:hypothetical protein
MLARGEICGLNVPSDRHPRRASDGCASIGSDGWYRPMPEREDEDSTTHPSSTQLKAIQQEHQALQVIKQQIIIT